MTDAEEKIYADGYADGYEEAMQEIEAVDVRDAIGLLRRAKALLLSQYPDDDYYLLDHINEFLKTTEKRQ